MIKLILACWLLPFSMAFARAPAAAAGPKLRNVVPSCRNSPPPAAWRSCQQTSDCMALPLCCHCSLVLNKKYLDAAKAWNQPCPCAKNCAAGCVPLDHLSCQAGRCMAYRKK